MLVVGSFYKNPDIYIEYGNYIRAKYDFVDEATKFFYEIFEIIYTARTQTLSNSTILAFLSEENNFDNLALYKQYGGWKTLQQWISLSQSDGVKNYIETLKKYSLLREYQRNGFNVAENILNHKNFEKLSAKDIYALIRAKTDRINTVILNDNEAEVLNSNIKNTILKLLEKPDFGIPLPFKIMNDDFRGLRKQSLAAVAMLSNSGKSRLMTKIIAYIALVLGEPVFVLLNEMSVQELRHALITTVINNPEFQELHNIKLNKKEKEIVMGMYYDNNGNLIVRDEENETMEQFINRLSSTSDEFNNIFRIANWVENEMNTKIIAKDLQSDYSDKTLEFEIRRANLVNKSQVFFFDTLKQPIGQSGDWSALKDTATMLVGLTKELNMAGYVSMQLTDDTNYIRCDELTSSNIASCKSVKHVLNALTLWKEIPKDEYNKYCYVQIDEEWGTPQTVNLNPNKRYYISNTDKNRNGEKHKLVFEVDLDLNIWLERGILLRKNKMS